jgi:hypothetical protein
MSIIQEALRKAQGEYVEKKIPDAVREEAVNSKTETNIPHIVKKTASMRLPALVSILTILLIVYGLNVSLRYSKNQGKEMKMSVVSAHTAKEADPIRPPNIGTINPMVGWSSAFALSGIMYVEKKPQAIINGYVLEEGDKINGATVLAIEKDCVLLGMNDKNVRLELNE